MHAVPLLLQDEDVHRLLQLGHAHMRTARAQRLRDLQVQEAVRPRLLPVGRELLEGKVRLRQGQKVRLLLLPQDRLRDPSRLLTPQIHQVASKH